MSSFDPSKNTQKTIDDDPFFRLLFFFCIFFFSRASAPLLLFVVVVSSSLSLKAHKIVPSFSVHRTPRFATDDDVSREKERDPDGLILSINPKNSFIDRVSLFLSRSLFDSLSLSLSLKGEENERKNEKRRTTTTSVAMMRARVCVTFSRTQKGVVVCSVSVVQRK